MPICALAPLLFTLQMKSFHKAENALTSSLCKKARKRLCQIRVTAESKWTQQVCFVQSSSEVNKRLQCFQ